MTAQELARKYIQQLVLAPHPEGGWFTLVHLSDDKILSPYVQQGNRGMCTIDTCLRSLREHRPE
jgi:predicted cupin superfamily sugar epimerase